jgi:hypothetical protein
MDCRRDSGRRWAHRRSDGRRAPRRAWPRGEAAASTASGSDLPLGPFRGGPHRKVSRRNRQTLGDRRARARHASSVGKSLSARTRDERHLNHAATQDREAAFGGHFRSSRDFRGDGLQEARPASLPPCPSPAPNSPCRGYIRGRRSSFRHRRSTSSGDDRRSSRRQKARSNTSSSSRGGSRRICYATLPSPANVPPLSSGRIRKRGGIMWRRASPWYFTTGER